MLQENINDLTTEFWTREQAVGLANHLLEVYGAKNDRGEQAVTYEGHVLDYKRIKDFRGIENGQQLVMHTVDGVILYLEVSAIMRPVKKEEAERAEA